MRLVRFALLVAALTGCAGIRDTVQLAAAAQPLRLSRVVLYENGLGTSSAAAAPTRERSSSWSLPPRSTTCCGA